MMDDETIKDLRILQEWRRAGGKHTYGDTNSVTPRGAGEALNRLIARIPEPPWEPTEAQVSRYFEMQGWMDTPEDRALAVRGLQKWHAAGFSLELDTP